MHVRCRTFLALLTPLLLAACEAESTSTDAEEDTRTSVGKADRFGSCQPKHQQAPLCSGPGTGSCWCDEACHDYGDCCADKAEACGGAPPACASAEVCASLLDEQVAWAGSTGWTQLDAAELDCGLVVVGHVTDGDFRGLRLWLLDPAGDVLQETDLVEVETATPKIAASGDAIGVTWSESDLTVHAAVLGTDLAGPVLVDVSGSQPAAYSAITNADVGHFIVAYETQTAAGGYAFASRNVGPQGTLGDDHEIGVASGTLGSGCYTFGDVARGPQGALAAWTHCASGRRALYARPLDLKGAPTGPAQLIEEASDEAYLSPYGADLAAVPGGFAIGYSIDRDPGSPSNTLRVVTVDPQAGVIAGPTSFADDVSGDAHFQPRLAAAAGGVAVAFYSATGAAAPYAFDSWLTSVDPSTATRSGPVQRLWPGRDGPPMAFTTSTGFGALWPQAGSLQFARTSCE